MYFRMEIIGNFIVKLSLRILMATFCGLVGAAAYADSRVDVKWTNEVGGVIKPTGISAGEPLTSLRMMTFTYEVIKACKRLSVFGHSYSSDGVQLAAFILTQRMDVVPGQKFRDEVPVTYEPGHYVVLDKAYCLG